MPKIFVGSLFWGLLSIWLEECRFATAHVALTFPPARKYDLDFLDTSRTGTLNGPAPFPCGMYKGDHVTQISAGDPLNVTWHLGYPHDGGFKLELLDSKDRFLLDLTPSGQYVGAGTQRRVVEEGEKTQSYLLNVDPDLECRNCTLRLVRQATEWGGSYRFKSCADISILPSREWSNKCSGHGRPKSGRKCECTKPYYGRFCQYKNDCDVDADCGASGRCIASSGTAIPNKECFCSPGFFGQTCEKYASLNKKSYTPSDYTEIKLRGEDFKFLWRFVGDGNGDEIEGVVIAKTTSYVAIGWRPSDKTTSCRKFPTDAPPPLTPGNPLHAMDCQDIIVAKVNGDGSNVGDYYTRDRSTPRRDEVYGGQDDLTAAVGWEEDGITTIMFRKPASGSQDSGLQDHDFGGDMTLIWAFGQSGVEFYKEDELKYHGGNRGQYKLETADESLSQQRIILIVAVSLITFILIIQAIHNLANGVCKPKPKGMDIHQLDMKDVEVDNINYRKNGH